MLKRSNKQSRLQLDVMMHVGEWEVDKGMGHDRHKRYQSLHCLLFETYEERFIEPCVWEKKVEAKAVNDGGIQTTNHLASE